MKCRSKRNDIAASIWNAIFSIFGEEWLSRVDNNTSAHVLAQWKLSEKMRNAYDELFNNNQLLSSMGYQVFKQYHGNPLPPMHCAYTLAICDILLNPASLGIKCSDRSVARHVNVFMVNILRCSSKINILLWTSSQMMYFLASHRK